MLHGTESIAVITRRIEADNNTACMRSWTETSHHYIADVFPTCQASVFNVYSPTVDEETAAFFQADNEVGRIVRVRFRRVFAAMMRFYGVSLVVTKGEDEGLTYSFSMPDSKVSWFCFWLKRQQSCMVGLLECNAHLQKKNKIVFVNAHFEYSLCLPDLGDTCRRAT
jgi:hypothetical protein